MILVDGATGYVGSHLVSKLTRDGHKVRCLVRPEAQKADVQFLQACNAEVTACSLLDPKVDLAFRGIETAVHLIGSIAPRKGEKLDDLHFGQTKKFVDNCLSSKVTKVVMVTALGTGEEAQSHYHATKWSAETYLRESGLDYVIVRPSLIVGRLIGLRDSKLVKRYRELIQNKKCVPLIAGGTNLIQPIFIGDLIQALWQVLLSDKYLGKTLELGGKDILTMKQFVQRLMEVLEIEKPVVPLPQPVAFLAAFFCELTQTVPLISRDQVRLAGQDNILTYNHLESLLAIEPTSLSHALMTYKGSETHKASTLEYAKKTGLKASKK